MFSFFREWLPNSYNPTLSIHDGLAAEALPGSEQPTDYESGSAVDGVALGRSIHLRHMASFRGFKGGVNRDQVSWRLVTFGCIGALIPVGAQWR